MPNDSLGVRYQNVFGHRRDKTLCLCLLTVGACLVGSLQVRAEFSNDSTSRDNGRDLEVLRLTLTGSVDAVTGQVSPAVVVSPPADLLAGAPSDAWASQTTLIQETKAIRLGIETLISAAGFLTGVLLWSVAVMRVYL